MIRFVCPHCDAVTRGIDDDLAGEIIMCRHCHERSTCRHTPAEEDAPEQRGSSKALWLIILGLLLATGLAVAIVVILLSGPPEAEPKQIIAKQVPDYPALANEIILRQKTRAMERRNRHIKEFDAGVRKSNEKLQDFVTKTFRWNVPIFDEYEKTGLEKTLPLLELLQKFEVGPPLTKSDLAYCAKKPKVFAEILKLTQNGARPLNEWRRAIDAEAASYRTKMEKISATIDAQITRVDKICDLVQAKETETALIACARAIKDDPNHAEPWIIKGVMTGLAKTDHGQAVADLERAMGLDKENPDPILARGLMRLRGGDKRQARADYQAAILIDTSLTRYGELFRD